MSKLLDALMMRPTSMSARVAPLTPAEIARPVPVAFIREPPSDLTSGSDINEAAVGAWPTLIDGGFKFKNGGWRKSVLRNVIVEKEDANYGGVTSETNFGFLWREFTGIGNHSGPIPSPYRPTFNNLTAISWALRVPNPNTKTNTTAQKGHQSVQTKSSTWNSPTTASLTKTGETLL